LLGLLLLLLLLLVILLLWRELLHADLQLCSAQALVGELQLLQDV
jgi:hypothetical protein